MNFMRIGTAKSAKKKRSTNEREDEDAKNANLDLKAIHG
jgi:hypothetical protein